MGHGDDIRTGRHRVFALHAHLVFVTKYRHAVFTAAHLARMEEIRRAVCADFGCELVRHYWPARRLWSGSYFAGSVGGAPLDVLRAYIEQQRRPRDEISPPA
jgi:putative transposase